MIIRLLAAVGVPPLGVFLARGIGGAFWLSCLLTLLAWLPGAAYALYIVLMSRDRMTA